MRRPRALRHSGLVDTALRPTMPLVTQIAHFAVCATGEVEIEYAKLANAWIQGCDGFVLRPLPISQGVSSAGMPRLLHTKKGNHQRHSNRGELSIWVIRSTFASPAIKEPSVDIELIKTTRKTQRSSFDKVSTVANESFKCLFCGKDASSNLAGSSDFTEIVNCDRCGSFLANKILLLSFRHGEKIQDGYLLSGFVREQNELELDPPKFSDHKVCEEIAKQLPRSISDRARKLLQAIARKTKFFGDDVQLIYKNDFPLAYASNEQELGYFVKYLKQRGFIEGEDEAPYGPAYFILTAEGFAEVERLKTLNVESHNAFVAMWFDDDMRDAYDLAIAPGIEDAGFCPMRIDLTEFNDDVVARILAEIREARFVVSDFTGHRNGVYFETGFAMGLGLPVIWLCRKDQIRDAHFDTNHFNHISWETPTELRERLAIRIKATIGLGTFKRESP